MSRRLSETCPCGSQFTADRPEAFDRGQMVRWREAHADCRKGARLRRRTSDEPLEAQPGLCGRLPSGETCVLKPNHDGAHKKPDVRIVETCHQEDPT